MVFDVFVYIRIHILYSIFAKLVRQMDAIDLTYWLHEVLMITILCDHFRRMSSPLIRNVPNCRFWTLVLYTK